MAMLSLSVSCIHFELSVAKSPKEHAPSMILSQRGRKMTELWARRMELDSAFVEFPQLFRAGFPGFRQRRHAANPTAPTAGGGTLRFDSRLRHTCRGSCVPLQLPLLGRSSRRAGCLSASHARSGIKRGQFCACRVPLTPLCPLPVMNCTLSSAIPPVATSSLAIHANRKSKRVDDFGRIWASANRDRRQSSRSKRWKGGDGGKHLA